VRPSLRSRIGDASIDTAQNAMQRTIPNRARHDVGSGVRCVPYVLQLEIDGAHSASPPPACIGFANRHDCFSLLKIYPPSHACFPLFNNKAARVVIVIHISLPVHHPRHDRNLHDDRFDGTLLENHPPSAAKPAIVLDNCPR
jgi:hypothetical protein